MNEADIKDGMIVATRLRRGSKARIEHVVSRSGMTMRGAILLGLALQLPQLEDTVNKELSREAN